MCQLVEWRRRLPEKAVPPRRHIGALSQRFPDNVSPEGIENTALHLPTSLACSIGNYRRYGKPMTIPPRFGLNIPLVYEQAAH